MLLLLAITTIFPAQSSHLLAATITVTNTNDSGAGSLRQAITTAQGTVAADVIVFNIPGAGVHTITPATALPTITQPLFIDGSTQPGYTTTPLIEIDATNVPSFASGIYFANNSDSGIKALCINRAQSRGVYMVNGTNMTVEDCIIGMDPTGLIPLGNVGLGVSFTGNGITVSGCVITNNEGGQFQNVSGQNIELTNNVIGLDITGTTPYPSTATSAHGIEVRASQNVLIQDNLVSGNTGHGLFLSGAGTNLEVLNNKIGTDITGDIAIGNDADGINLAVYSPVDVFGNVIADSGRYGIIAANNNFSFLRNRVGVGINGADLGNSSHGVYLQDQSTHQFVNSQIGDGTLANANVIAYNGKTDALGNGVSVRRISTNRIPINTNIIYDNANLGIDLQINGVSMNDAGDGDVGANDFLNFPVINSVTLGSLIIDFDLDVPAGDYRMEVYGIPAGQGDPTQYGEGNTYLGTFNINHTGSGVENFVETLPGNITINAGDDISMTSTLCTDATCTSFEVTSEFSQLKTVAVLPNCNSETFHQAIKRVGAPTICDILAANPADPIGVMDCDGGGQTNLDECNAGQNPEDPSDDSVLSPIARIESSVLANNGTANLDIELIGCDGNAPQCGEEITYKISDDDGIELEVVTCQYGVANSCTSIVTGGYLGLQATASSYDSWLNHITGDPAGTCNDGTFSFNLDKESWAATNGLVYNGYIYGTRAEAGPSAGLGCDIAASQATDIYWDIFVGGGTDDVCIISSNPDNTSKTCSMLFQYSGGCRMQSNQTTFVRLTSNHSSNLGAQYDHKVIPDPTTLSSISVDPTFYNTGAYTTLQHGVAWFTTNQAVTVNSTGYTTVNGNLAESNGVTGSFSVGIENVVLGGGFVEFGTNHTIRTSGDCDGIIISFQINNNFGVADDDSAYDNAEWRVVQGATTIDSGSITPPVGAGASADVYVTNSLAEGCYELILDIDYTSHDGVMVEGNSIQDLLVIKQF